MSQKAIIEITVGDDGETKLSVQADMGNPLAMETALAAIHAYIESQGIEAEDVRKEAKFFGPYGELLGESKCTP